IRDDLVTGVQTCALPISQTTFATGFGPRSVAVGDFNGDSKIDVAVGDSLSNNLLVLLNTTSAGTFWPSLAAQTTIALGAGALFEIGRASCRERGGMRARE